MLPTVTGVHVVLSAQPVLGASAQAPAISRPLLASTATIRGVGDVDRMSMFLSCLRATAGLVLALPGLGLLLALVLLLLALAVARRRVAAVGRGLALGIDVVGRVAAAAAGRVAAVAAGGVAAVAAGGVAAVAADV